jgi:hypothetical protein
VTKEERERERVVCKKKMKDVMTDKEWKQNNPKKHHDREGKRILLTWLPEYFEMCRGWMMCSLRAGSNPFIPTSLYLFINKTIKWKFHQISKKKCNRASQEAQSAWNPILCKRSFQKENGGKFLNQFCYWPCLLPREGYCV